MQNRANALNHITQLNDTTISQFVQIIFFS